ncbi:extracellular solute-binding protein [Ruminiclostridium herbifermentans]|uniref:Extracellular solute-binding protein n=1 Tax=Ruminiclostridium herbifermentans TaxID=2488810 RepID=A0A4U7JGW3_9FIRM|nr:ABC transporter substrate-binding protein [Ruminiclostridium herbifermentans]QNU67161.1 extracellular solute-binding protein [Ruminiclostridium herbifermentans]
MLGKKRLVSLFLALAMMGSVIAGCGGNTDSKDSETASTNTGSKDASLEPIEISFFISDPGQAATPDNKIYKLIQEKLGVTCNFEFLVGDKDQKIGVMIAGGDYPDVVSVDTFTNPKFTGAGALIPLEDLIAEHAPNLKKHYEPYKNKVKDSSDGHFYIMPDYGVFYNEYQTNIWQGPAFWIQKAVLAEFGYPQVKTLDQYFDLIEKYQAKYPEIDGQKTIGFEILSDGWRDFCLKNPPEHLIGHPNDGQVVVDYETNVAEFFWDKDYAKRYYKKLNEMYNKGLIDPETFTMNYDQYMAKLSSGRVLGTFDQFWNFSNADLTLKQQNKIERTWAPCAITYDESIKPYYQDRDVLNVNTGFAITTSCKDPVRVIKFFDTLLTEEWQKILGWGIEGEDYFVDENGQFYRNEEQRRNYEDQSWRLANMAYYLWYYAPKMEGSFSDGNACTPGFQKKEFYESLLDYDKNFLKQYGYEAWTQFLNDPPENRVSYPAWGIDLVDGSPASLANTKIGETGTKYLPKCILAKPGEFDKIWDEYVTELHKCDIQAYLDRINDQLKWRAENWK